MSFINPIAPRFVSAFYESPPVLSPPVLQVTPLTNFNSAGQEGGPFTPLTKVYRLKNVGGETLHWTAGAVPEWIGLSALSGNLNAGQFIDVTVTLDPDTLNSFIIDDNRDHDGRIEFVNTTNGRGDTSRLVTVDVGFESSILFEQFDGPVAYPACAFSFGGVFYKTQTATGNHKMKYAPVAGSVHLRDCSITGDPPAYGIVTTTISGSVTKSIDCETTGAINVTRVSEGITGAYSHPINLSGTGDSIDAAWSDAFAEAFPGFFSGEYAEDFDLDAQTATRSWFSPNAPGGFFSGSVGGEFDHVYCQGPSASIVYSDPISLEELAIALARSGTVGSPAQTQQLTAYDEGSRTYTGNFSRAVINVPVDPTREQLTGIFKFLVTPTVGDAYEIEVTKDFDISGPTVTGTVLFPAVVDATVKMTSWSYSYQKSVYDSFNSFSIADSLTGLPSSPTWHSATRLGAPSPNTDCWDSFEEFPLVTGPLTTLITGQRWADQGRLGTLSRIDCFDDFESYPVGAVELMHKGVGWKGAGHTHVSNYQFAYDDFESYPVGAISALNFTSTDNKWAADGRLA